MSKSVIVTGVTGQDGSYMVDYLLDKYEDIKVYGGVRELSKKNHENVSHVNDDRFSLVPFDLNDPYLINDTIEKIKPDYFVNFAASSFVGSSWSNPVLTMEVNAIGVLHILEAIRRTSPKTRFYQANSSEMFGDIVKSPQNEEHPLRPRSPYGASKASAAHLVKVYRESYDLYAVQGICFNHESPRRGKRFVTRKITSELSRIESELAHGVNSIEPMKVGNLYARRDWSHAADFMDGIWKMLNQKEYPQDYVLASGKIYSVKEFINECLKIFKISGNWVGSKLDEKFITRDGREIIAIDPDFYRPAEVELLRGDNSRIRAELGWEPKYTISSLIYEMCMNDRIVAGGAKKFESYGS